MKNNIIHANPKNEIIKAICKAWPGCVKYIKTSNRATNKNFNAERNISKYEKQKGEKIFVLTCET